MEQFPVAYEPNLSCRRHILNLDYRHLSSSQIYLYLPSQIYLPWSQIYFSCNLKATFLSLVCILLNTQNIWFHLLKLPSILNPKAMNSTASYEGCIRNISINNLTPLTVNLFLDFSISQQIRIRFFSSSIGTTLMAFPGTGIELQNPTLCFLTLFDNISLSFQNLTPKNLLPRFSFSLDKNRN